MTGITADPTDPRLGRGTDTDPVPQNEVYLVLSDEERAKGFIRPVRASYLHVGIAGPKYPLRDLTEEEKRDHPLYAKYEDYPASESPKLGRWWTQESLDAVGKGCGTLTTMGPAIAETYARSPFFYGSTYCVSCQKHRAVGEAGEFVWLDGTRVGT
jgi:hypothetical protein